ncbi:hypothetical protein [Catenulispora sp. MAP5-51]|uniref:hypothetical protein n=1 Tax=unclassified Catenulispora TaxID=414885 RepID=UPI0035164900
MAAWPDDDDEEDEPDDEDGEDDDDDDDEEDEEEFEEVVLVVLVVLGAVVAGCNPELPGFACAARGTVAAIATPPATLAAVTPQVTAEIRTNLRRASRSMTPPPQPLFGSPPTVAS